MAMAISQEQLLPCLLGTLSANPAERLYAEKVLSEASHMDGFCFNLLKIAATEQQAVPAADVRQVAAIYLKNAVKRRWGKPSIVPGTVDLKPEDHPLTASDKTEVMANLHECVIRSPPLVQKQLLECAKEIVSQEYPHPWGALLPEMIANITSNNVLRMTGSLLMMRTVARRLEFMTELRTTLDEFCTEALPVLLPLLQKLLTEQSAAPELAMMMKTILKIFWPCTYIDIPTVMAKDPAHTSAWLNTLIALLERPVPDEGQALDDIERGKSPWWKLRKWTLVISKRMFERYGDPRIALSTEAAAFSAIFASGFNIAFLKAVMKNLEDVAKGVWHSQRVLILLFEFTEAAINPPDTYKVMEPLLLDILVHAVLPSCYFTAADAQQWEEDPMEVIRKNSIAGFLMSEDEMFDPRNAATRLVTKVMDAKKCQARMLDPFMGRIIGISDAYRAAWDANPGGVPPEVAFQMDGAALVLGMLLEEGILTTKRNAKYRDNLETMIQQYLLPLFQSPYGFLRAKACWLSSKFADNCSFRQADGSKARGAGPLFDKLFSDNLQCMHDRELPVQVEAVNSFREFVEALADAERLEEVLHPILGDLLKHLFALASVIEASDVMVVLTVIVENIGDDVQPFAIDVCSQLVSVYAKVIEEKDADEDADEIMDSSLHIMKPIVTILDACSTLPGTLVHLEAILLPMLETMCDNNADEVFDQVCELLSYFTYFTPEISPRVWAFWPKLETVLKSWGIDLVESIIVPLDHFICKGKATFVTSTAPNYRESLFSMVSYCLTGDFTELEVAPAAKLLDVVLLNCAGCVDEWVWPYLSLAIGRIEKVQEPHFATLLMNVVPAALFYNAALTLQLLEQHGKTDGVFTLWFKMLEQSKFVRRIYDKKLTCLGLTCLLALPDTALPNTLRQGLVQIFTTVLRLVKEVKEMEEAADSDEESLGDASDAGDQGDDDEADEIDAVADDALYLEELAKRAARIRRAADDEPIDFGEWTDEEEIDSALDQLDALESLSTALTHMQTVLPERFEGLVNTLDDAGKQELQRMLQSAHISKAKKSHEALQRAGL